MTTLLFKKENILNNYNRLNKRLRSDPPPFFFNLFGLQMLKAVRKDQSFSTLHMLM